MQINITGHHVELTDPLRDYVASKLGRLERHESRITHADVVLNVEKLRQKVEATIRMAGMPLEGYIKVPAIPPTPAPAGGAAAPCSGNGGKAPSTRYQSAGLIPVTACPAPTATSIKV